MDSSQDITLLLQAAGKGDRHAAEELLPLVYGELRKLAGARMAQESPGQTLQPTALVHEAYLRLVGREDPGWDGRGHFFASAARAMRRILVDRARSRGSVKHGGGQHPASLEHEPAGIDSDGAEDGAGMVALDEALDELERIEPRLVDVVHLRYFAGLPSEAIARTLGVSKRTVERDWLSARAWLHDAIEGSAS